MDIWKKKCEELLKIEYSDDISFDIEDFFSRISSPTKDKIIDYKNLYFHLRKIYHVDFLEEYKRLLNKDGFVEIKNINFLQ